MNIRTLMPCAWSVLLMVSVSSAQVALPEGFVSPIAPPDIPGGAQSADLERASVFAWQEFIALNWPAVPQTGAPNTRDTADPTKKFGDQSGPLVWHTFRGKVEIYPGMGDPTGYVDDPGRSYGYDDAPKYIYSAEKVGTYPNMLPQGEVPPCTGQTAVAHPAWINLDEKNEISLATMFAGVVATSSFPEQQILFMAKANRTEYAYVASHQWWGKQEPPFGRTMNYVQSKKTSPPAGSPDLVSFPFGTIEVKAAWRRLTAQDDRRRFHIARVRYYEDQQANHTYAGQPGNTKYPCYREEDWGLIALHIIQKTPSAPYFIYVTFGQADNVLDEQGNPVEDADGNLIRNQNATPLDPRIISVNATPTKPQRLRPKTVSSNPAKRLYYRNTSGDDDAPQGTVSVNRRIHAIPQTVVQVNKAAHAVLAAYNEANHIPSSPWLYYKLVNVQWKPIDKQPGITYTGPDVATYYQANIVVETDYNLQVFSGRIAQKGTNSDYTKDGGIYKNVFYSGNGYNMGGCMGCHGNATNLGSDFSFILLGQSVQEPERAEPASLDDTRLRRLLTVSESQSARQVVSGYFDALKNNDLESAMSHFGDHYSTHQLTGDGSKDPSVWRAGVSYTHEELRNLLQEYLSNSTFENTLTFLHTDIGNNTAIVVTREKGSSTPREGAARSWEGTRIAWGLARINGKWKIVSSVGLPDGADDPSASHHHGAEGVGLNAPDESDDAGSEVVGHDCGKLSQVPDPAPPLNKPDRYAWQLFVEVNRKALVQRTFKDKNGKAVTTNNALWESWADDQLTFPKHPDPSNPPQWPEQTPAPKTLLVPGKGSVHGPDSHGEDFVLDTGGEEVHRNKATFDYVIQNNLWYTQGVATFFRSGSKVDFPIDSIEVKANWAKIEPSKKHKYHWNYDEKGDLFGLVAMHITSKALPNWFWCTFEWADNPGRCDFIGCHDCFGVTPHHTPSNTEKVGQQYAAGTLTSQLLALFEQGGLTGPWGEEWKNYRLKGSQTDFTDPTGRPVLLGNSVTEGGFAQTASCMTCHARAAVDSTGKNAFPVFGEKQPLPLQNTSPDSFQTQFSTYNGVPDPSWFYSFTGKGTKLINLQTDFVWAIPFKANPAKTE